MSAKILIATPSYAGKRYCYQKYIDALNAIDYPKDSLNFLMLDNTIPGDLAYGEIPLNFKAEIIRMYGKNRQLNSREVLALCYSVIFCYAEAFKYDYLLILEADVLIPPHGLKRLIETAKEYSGLVAPITFRANGKHLQIYHDDMTLHKQLGKDKLYRITRTPYSLDELSESVTKVGSATFSCVLIPLKYVSRLKVNWEVDHYNHPDGFFYDMVKKLNIPVWCDSTVHCEHLQQPFASNVVW